VRATSVANPDALGRPHRSVLVLTIVVKLIKKLFGYVKLSSDCRCGSQRPYRTCCFREELIGFVIAMVILGVILTIPSEGWPSRIIRSIVGLLSWICVFAMLREWIRKRRARRRKDEHEA
jgi:quinol-cytochrome oxidoreductase complex cytochrome b subunit